MAFIIAIAVFIAVTALILAMQFREQERAGFSEGRLKRATGQAPAISYGLGSPGLELRGSRISSSQAVTQLLSGLKLAYNIERHLNRSDWNTLKVSDFLLISGVAGGLAFAIVARVTGLVWIALVAGIIGLFIPRFLLARNIKKRRNRFNEQLIEVLSQMANSLKAGFGLLQAIRQAADEAKPPISTELRQTLREIQVGASVEDAFNRLNERVGSDDLDIVITAILVQRGAGGSLAELIEGVGHTMRERIRIRGEINTLTTQGKYTGYLIGALPILLAAGFFVINRRYEQLLFSTNLGHVMLAAWAIMQTIGLLVIRKILDIEL
jgi:tight adherence protein B